MVNGLGTQRNGPVPTADPDTVPEELVYDPDTGSLVSSGCLIDLGAPDCPADCPELIEPGETAAGQDGIDQLECDPDLSETAIPVADSCEGPDLIYPAPLEFPEDAPDVEPLHSGGTRPPGSYGRALGYRFLLVFAVLCAVALGYYLIQIDEYRAEFHIVYPPEAFSQGGQRVWALDKELRVLESPVIAYLVARDLTSGEPGKSASGADQNIPVAYLPGGGDSTVSTAMRQFSDAGRFVRWFSANLEVSPVTGKGMVVVSLTGSDPNFLKTVLVSYIRQTQNYIRQAALRQPDVPDREFDELQPEEPASPRSHPESLGVTELQAKECEMALGEMNSGKGMFRGFLSDEHLNALPTLKTLQAKIVDLEIEKIALSDHFNPASREVREKDHQIKKLRMAMQECVSQHLSYLKRRATALAAEPVQLERKVSHEQASKEPVGTLCVGSPSPGGGGSCRQGPGIHGVVETPFIARQPLLARAARYFANISGSSPRTGESKIFETKGQQDSGSSSYGTAAGSGPEGK